MYIIRYIRNVPASLLKQIRNCLPYTTMAMDVVNLTSSSLASSPVTTDTNSKKHPLEPSDNTGSPQMRKSIKTGLHEPNLTLEQAHDDLHAMLKLYHNKFPDDDIFKSFFDVMNNQDSNKIISLFRSNNMRFELQPATSSFKEPESPIKKPAIVAPPPFSPGKMSMNQPRVPLKKPLQLNQQRSMNTLQLATQMPVKKVGEETDDTKHVKVISLSKEQEDVAEMARRGYNIFYTGSAGTGKSFLLKSLIKNLREQHPPNSVAVTASTGLAAYNIGGLTLNSYTGIGLGKGLPGIIAKRIRRRTRTYERWMDLRVLIIDEISMIDGGLLDKLDQIARHLKDEKKPFGGIQVIFCGDFYQLPPVSRNKRHTNNSENIDSSEQGIFAFQSKFWKNHVKIQVLLTKVFRQQGDQQFLDMLQEVRDGYVSDKTVTRFNALTRELKSNDNIVPTQLFATRNEVDTANSSMLKIMKGNLHTFIAMDSGKLINTPEGKNMLNSFLAPEKLELKVNSQVMMVKNMDETLVNGSLGTVVGFLSRDTYHQYITLAEDLERLKYPANVNVQKEDEEDKFKLNKGENKDKPTVDEMLNDEYGLLSYLSKPQNSMSDSIFDFLKDVKEKVYQEIGYDSSKQPKKEIEQQSQQLEHEGQQLKSEEQQLKADEQQLVLTKPEPQEHFQIPIEWELENNNQNSSVNHTENTDLSIQEINGQITSTSFNANDESSKLSIEVGFNDKRLESIQRKEVILQQLKNSEKPGNLCPLIKFRLSNGQHRTVLIEREKFTVEDVNDTNPNKTPLICREQYPLMLAWALSIHKSQGQTLKFVSVNLRNIFEKGQAYVALSRAEHRRGLQVLNFAPTKVLTDPDVKKFYSDLKDAETVMHEIDNQVGDFRDYLPNFNDEASIAPSQVTNISEKSASIDAYPSQYFEKQKQLREERERKKKERLGITVKGETTPDTAGKVISGKFATSILGDDNDDDFGSVFHN